jgi:hypothetical protein
MPRLVARVIQVLRPGIHKIGTVQDGTLEAGLNLPFPERVEIEFGGRHPRALLHIQMDPRWPIWTATCLT